MRSAFFSAKTLEIANKILEWAGAFLATENENMQRPYGGKIVCPYVASSLENDSFYMVFHPEVNGANVEEIETIMLHYMGEFELTPPFDPSEQTRKTLLIVFPEIPSREAFVLDTVHKHLKTEFVKRGMMIGQFHPNCEEPSVHNGNFRVCRSPYPLMAIRRMAFHDILFLWKHNDPSWFDEYNRRYGERFKDENEGNKYLRHYYEEAKKKFLKK